MRNSTKLRLLLQKYEVRFDLIDEEIFVMMLIDKISGAIIELQSKTYADVLNKGVRELKKQLTNTNS